MNDLTEVELYWQQGRIERLQERILMPPSLARLVQKLPIARGDDWSALLPVAVDPKPATEGTSGDDPDNSGIRREATLPEYEAIAPESLQLADPFAILVDDADDESVRADMLHQRMRTIVRQASLDPGDGLGLRGAMKEQFTVYLEPNLMQALTEYAERRGKPKSLVAEAAIASFLSPDSSERQEAALARRLDRITRQMERLERDVGISVETVALFIRFWLMATPSLSEQTQASARAKGAERYKGLMHALGRRLAKGPGFIQEVSQDIGKPAVSNSGIGEDSAQSTD